MTEEVLSSSEKAQQLELACIQKAGSIWDRIWATLDPFWGTSLPEELASRIVDVFGIKQWTKWLFDGVMNAQTKEEYCLITKLRVDKSGAIDEIKQRLLSLDNVRIEVPQN